MVIEKIKFLAEISYSSNEENEKLKESIKNFGIQQPLIILKSEKKFLIIDGYKRFNLSPKINSFFIIDDSLSNEDILIEYCKKNFYRGFNDIEIANILNVVERYFNNNVELIKKILKILNIKFSENLISSFKKLNNLSDKGKEKLLNGTLNKNLAVKIADLDKNSQSQILKLFENLRLNNNKQKKVFSMLFDIAKRKDINLKQLIDTNFKKYLNESFSKNLEKEFFDNLIMEHSPNFYKFNNKFLNFKKKFFNSNKEKINFYSPTFFEDENYKIELFFKDLSELSNKLQLLNDKLEKIKKEQEFHELFN